jgi:hypothetical protein
MRTVMLKGVEYYTKWKQFGSVKQNGVEYCEG